MNQNMAPQIFPPTLDFHESHYFPPKLYDVNHCDETIADHRSAGSQSLGDELSTSPRIAQFQFQPLLNPEPDEHASPAPLSPNQSYSGVTNLHVSALPDQEGQCLWSDALETKVKLEERNRECFIFEARGRQLEKAQEQIAFLKEELAKYEQLSQHQSILAKAEIETLVRELERSEGLRNAAEKANAALLEANSNLASELDALKKLKTEVDKKLADMEATNASLSAELVQLSSGTSLSLAKQRENNLADCLARRHAMAEDVLREDLDIANRRIADKEDELLSIRKDLEAERLRSQDLVAEHADYVENLQTKLKVAQDRCNELSSSSLCTEVHELRRRLQEILTSKKEELKDVREQLAIYEQSLGISGAVGNAAETESSLETSGLFTTPRHHLPLFQDSGGSVLSTVISRPLSNRRRRSCQSVTFAPHVEDEDNDLSGLRRPRRPSSAVSAPLCSTWNQGNNVVATVSDDEVISAAPSRRSALGPTPGVSFAAAHGLGSASDLGFLKAQNTNSALKTELKVALTSYRAKRQQITALHEKLFATRCELHKTIAERDRAEAARNDLQLRILALEKELSLQEDARKPGPRESALVGQLERLQADYSRLEAELQTLRCRLQDALAAEARAAAAERASRERLEASTAEREAAVERARAACEAHYTSARRRLEAELNTEHERLLQQMKQEVFMAREECSAYRSELERVARMYQEARAATTQAVELTLAEAMRERENERIRFWREELPRQIEQARSSWLSDTEKRAALEASRIRTFCQAEFESRLATYAREHQAELDRLRRSKCMRDQAVSCTQPAIVTVVATHDSHPLIASLLSDDLFTRLVSALNNSHLLDLIEDSLTCVLQKVARTLVQRVSDVASKSLLAALSEFGVLEEDQHRLTEKLSLRSAEEPVVVNLLCMLEKTVSSDSSMEVAIIRKLASKCAAFGVTTVDSATQVGGKSVEAGQASVSSEVLKKIKGEMLSYVESCQERYARTLQMNFVRIHRRACRQLTQRLCAALVEAGVRFNRSTSLPSSVTTARQSNESMKFSELQIESLLHIIDATCTSTEVAVSDGSRKCRPIFSPTHPPARQTQLLSTKTFRYNDQLPCSDPVTMFPVVQNHAAATNERTDGVEYDLNGLLNTKMESPKAPAPVPRVRSRPPKNI
ncbi:unnamed protein product [Mesocestoides corti]|uniref:Uncharacterized protein n=1 Tax=Mesocestoides corti TaxID=53468 RepID=A0A158QUL8_MESCO|nr:unnamed protein product [Mesocestoides corti]